MKHRVQLVLDYQEYGINQVVYNHKFSYEGTTTLYAKHETQGTGSFQNTV